MNPLIAWEWGSCMLGWVFIVAGIALDSEDVGRASNVFFGATLAFFVAHLITT